MLRCFMVMRFGFRREASRRLLARTNENGFIEERRFASGGTHGFDGDEQEALERSDHADAPATSDDLDEIRARSFLKFTKPYSPPVDLEQQLMAILTEVASGAFEQEQWKRFCFDGRLEEKNRFLSLAEKALGKRVLSSCLHELKTVDDALRYFQVPVTNVTSYSEMSRDSTQLPSNLQVIEDAVRFHPLTDTQFGGVSAFPKSSTYVPSLRHRRYLKGYRAKTEWHHFEDKNFDYTAPPADAPWLKKKAERLDTVKPSRFFF